MVFGFCAFAPTATFGPTAAFAKGTAAKLPKHMVYFDRYNGGQYLIDVMINGQGPFVFMIDTGATKTSMFVRTQKKLGLVDQLGEQLIISGMTTVEYRPVVSAQSFKFANINLSDLEVVTLKDWHAVPSQVLDGIIGLDILDNYILSFDHNRAVVSFKKRGRVRLETIVGWRRIKLIANPYKGKDYGLLFTHTKIGDTYIPTMIDTGAGFTSMSWSSVNSRLMKGHKKRLRDKWVVQGAIGEFSPKLLVTFDKINIGGLTFNDHNLFIMDHDNLPINANGKFPLVITGVDYMNNRDFILDLKKDYLYISPNRRKRSSRRKFNREDIVKP